MRVGAQQIAGGWRFVAWENGGVVATLEETAAGDIWVRPFPEALDTPEGREAIRGWRSAMTGGDVR